MATNYNFVQDGYTYSLDDVFVSIDSFTYIDLWAWGWNLDGQVGDNTSTARTSPVRVDDIGIVSWKQISAGVSHTTAIKTDGTLWTWGSGANGRLGNNATTDRSTPVTTFAGGTDWKQVSAGYLYTAAIKTDGTLWTWGSGSSGQLGTNDAYYRLTPVTTFAGGTNWADTATTEPEDLYTLSAGGSYTAAIKTDGTLWTWGSGSSGRLGNNDTTNRSTPVTTFAGGTDWKQVSSGSATIAAIKTDGSLWVWGNGANGRLGTNATTNRSTPVTTFAGGTDWKQVSVGDQHTAAIKTDGTLWTWGNGLYGRLGTNDATSRSTPVTTFAGGNDWKQVSSGSLHTAAIKTDGTLWVWGNGDVGKLGNNATTDRSTPITTFAGGNDWKQVSSGSLHTAAIKTDGTLWVWGNGDVGKLGNNATTNRSTPVTTFAGGTDWKQVSAGSDHTAAIKTDGTLWTWGIGSLGRLGNNATTSRSTPVTTFAGGTNWKQVSSGFDYTAAVKTDGTLWTWGNGNIGQLGVNDTTNRSTPVTTFAGGTNWKQVSSGDLHTVALRDDGVNKELFVFGNNILGQLGISLLVGDTFRSTPVTTFAGGTNWKQVSAGGYHTAAIKTDGTLWTWGLGSSGQLGNDDILNNFTPVTTFAGGTNWKQISAGGSHTAAIKTDGTLWTWGSGSSGRLGTNDTTSRSTPVTTFAGGTDWRQISAGDSHTAAIKTDGTLWTWGFNFRGELGRTTFSAILRYPKPKQVLDIPWNELFSSEPEDLYIISAGGSHTAAIKTDGTLWTWGNGSSGQLGTNDTTNRLTPVTTFAGGTNWKQVSAGIDHTAAIKTDGTLWTWGSGSSGQLGNNDTTNRSTPVTTFAGGTDWKQVSAGSDHTAAIKTDGTLWTWGAGSSGQLGNNDTRSTPVTTFAGGTNWADTATTEPEDLYTLSAGRNHTTAIKTDGTLWTWGSGSSGQLGNNDTTNIVTPVTTFAGGTDWKQISAGESYTAAIKTDGTLWTWGSGSSGQLGVNDKTNRSTPVTTFAGGTDWKQVSAGSLHTAAIKTDGTLWVWGEGSFGILGNNDTTDRSTPVTTFAGGTNWKQVSAGYAETAAIKTDGTLWTWGSGSNGRLGTNDTTDRSTPVTTFAGGTDWKQVSVANAMVAAIKTDGTLWVWGYGLNGRLGTNDETDRLTPVTTFAGGTDWKQVSSGVFHTAAIKTDGTLWTWGSGSSGKLGNNDITNRSTPVTTFAGGTNWKQVSAGGFHTVALRDDGVNKELFVFGNTGLLGINKYDYEKTPVTTFAGGTNWKQVSSGDTYTAAIKTDGTLWTWGNGSSGRLGTNDATSRLTPVTTFAGGTDWKQISAGGSHTAAIKTDGTLWVWGEGSFGILGNNDTTDRSTPVTTFAGGTNWKQVSAGYAETAAIKTDGTLWTWGNGSSGRLGTNDTTNRSTPVTTFAGGTDWKQISAGSDHTAAIKTDGTLWTWGNGRYGQLGSFLNEEIPYIIDDFGKYWKYVTCGNNYTLTLKTDGTLWGFGNNSLGDVVTSGLNISQIGSSTFWKSISAGPNHAVGTQYTNPKTI